MSPFVDVWQNIHRNIAAYRRLQGVKIAVKNTEQFGIIFQGAYAGDPGMEYVFRFAVRQRRFLFQQYGC
jgi:hypothetical protein